MIYKSSAIGHIKNEAYWLIRHKKSDQLRSLAQELTYLQEKIWRSLQDIKNDVD